MLSREFPPLKLENLKMEEKPFVLNNQELAFTKNETKEFFKKRGYSLNTDQLGKIYSSTEGWIGGLILLSEYLNRFQEHGGEKVLNDLPGHFKREIFQFFNQEIFSTHPPNVQEFLIKSSIFDTIEPRWVKDFLGIENAEVSFSNYCIDKRVHFSKNDLGEE